MLRCAENLVKAMFFEGFHFLNLFTDLESRGRVLGHILVTLGDLGVTLSGFGGYWKQA